jgi:hypothetical protein
VPESLLSTRDSKHASCHASRKMSTATVSLPGRGAHGRLAAARLLRALAHGALGADAGAMSNEEAAGRPSKEACLGRLRRRGPWWGREEE